MRLVRAAACAFAALFVVGSVFGPGAVSAAEAQSTRRVSGRSSSGRTTRGRTRRVRRRSNTRGRSRRGARRRSGRRRSRRRRVRLGAGFDRDRCVRIDSDGWCEYDERVDDRDPTVPFGLSLGFVGAVLPTQVQGVGGDRVLGPDLDIGLLAPMGVDARLWTGWDRFRIGGLIQGGGVPTPSGGNLDRPEDAFESDSDLSPGWWLSLYGIAAYQPHLDDVVQLWLGGRVGAHLLGVPVTSLGRPYGSLRRHTFSAGPEVGVRFSAHVIGLMIWGYADLVSPGLVQLSAAFVVEWPKPPGAAF